MEGIKKCFLNLGIRKKLLVVFLPLSILPVILVSVISNYNYTTNRINETIDNAINKSSFMIHQAENVFFNAESCANLIALSLNQVFSSDDEKDYELLSYVEKKHTIENHINYALMIFEDIYEAVYIDMDHQVYTSGNNQLAISTHETFLPFLASLKATTGYNQWFDMQEISLESNENKELLLPVGKKVFEIETGHTKGYLMLFVKEARISSVFQYMKEYNSSHYYIVDEFNRIVSSSDEIMLLKTIEDKEILNWMVTDNSNSRIINRNSNRSVMTKHPINNGNWMFIYGVDIDELTRDYQTVQRVYIILSISFILVIIYGSIVLARMIVKPVDYLNQAMKRVEKNNEYRCVENYSEDEVGQLTRRFNKMTSKIRRLLEDIQHEQIAKRKYELDLIQAQIKPHFLYNTLDTVYVLIHMNRNQDAKKATKNLADFYRASLNSGDEIISIKAEIEMIQKYLYIQNLRYSDVFEHAIEIEEEILQQPILKLSIQPLVENAIYHGLKNKSSKGNLWIRGYKTSHWVCIEVEDDGVGISDEKLKEIWTSSNHVGLSNVDKRIKLYFGEEYGLEIESKKDGGTKVFIKIPMETRCNNDKSNNC